MISAGIPMAAPARVCEWRGEPRTGIFVHLDASTCAMHVGRGTYLTLHVERDLNGVLPGEARRLMLRRSGTVREPDARRSYSAY